MIPLSQHLIVLPILLPLAAAAVMLLLNEKRRAMKSAISLATTVTTLGVSVALMVQVVVAGKGGSFASRAYALGNWPAPFGIVLVIDWLSALMLVLASVLAVAALIYALARWERAGPRFHPLFLLQLMGLNGAFLSGDLFNLFVFFEVLLAASYALLLHGSGTARVKAALHYVSVNVLASLLFLTGVALIYGTTGTLNMADLSLRIPQVTGSELPLLQAGMGILGVAFMIKAGLWPLGIWLPRTYAAAAAPSAALFAILSKVGIYAVLRVYLLLHAEGDGWAESFGEEWLLYGGLATIMFGTIGVLAVRTLKGVAGYCVLISSGTLLAMTGAGNGAVMGGALFYLVISTLGIAAFYLLIELVERTESAGDPAVVVEPAFEDEYTSAASLPEDEVGVVIPATIALLGSAFILTALILAGLPPLSGFIAKFAMIRDLLAVDEQMGPSRWALVALMILSGLAVLIATTRAGSDLLWTPERPQPDLRLAEAAPVGILLGLGLALTIWAGPVMRYMERTGFSLHDRQGYIAAVLGAAQTPRTGHLDR